MKRGLTLVPSAVPRITFPPFASGCLRGTLTFRRRWVPHPPPTALRAPPILFKPLLVTRAPKPFLVSRTLLRRHLLGTATSTKGPGSPLSGSDRGAVSGHKGVMVALLHTVLDQRQGNDLWQLQPDHGGGQDKVLPPPFEAVCRQ